MMRIWIIAHDSFVWWKICVKFRIFSRSVVLILYSNYSITTKEYNERLGIKKLPTLPHRVMCWTVFAMHYTYRCVAPCIDSKRQREYFNFHTAAKHFQSTTSIGTNKKRTRKWTNLKVFCVFCVMIFSHFRRCYFIFFVSWILFRISRCRLWYDDGLYNNEKWLCVLFRIWDDCWGRMVCAVIFSKLLKLCGYVLH